MASSASRSACRFGNKVRNTHTHTSGRGLGALEVAAKIEQERPLIFVFENVKGIREDDKA